MAHHPWFTIETIDSTTYVISEYGHWEQTHCYLLLGETSAVLIDTGTGIGDIKAEVDALTELPITVITTHCHWDHVGGHGQFSTIAIHEADKDWLENGLPIPDFVTKAQVMKQPFTKSPPPRFSIDDYTVFTGNSDLILRDGDTIDLGKRKLQILHTPGHSPGHISIYEQEREYLFTGDILYQGTIYANYPSTDPTSLHASIQRLDALQNIALLLPGHNNLHIPIRLLRDFRKLCDDLAVNNDMHHGTGLHQTQDIGLLL